MKGIGISAAVCFVKFYSTLVPSVPRTKLFCKGPLITVGVRFLVNYGTK